MPMNIRSGSVNAYHPMKPPLRTRPLRRQGKLTAARPWAAIVATALVVTATPPALAAKCPAAKLQATGKRMAAELGCRSKAVGKGTPVDQACIDAAVAKLALAFPKAETKGDCPITGDHDTIAASVSGVVAGIVAQLGGPGPSACTERKLKAAAKKAASKLACRAAAVKKGPGHGIDPKCIQKAGGAFLKAFAKAEAKGGCIAVPGDATAVEALVDEFIRDSRDALAPAISTCTPLTATVVHGAILPNTRLAKIVKGKVPCLHGEDATCTSPVSSGPSTCRGRAASARSAT
jgi:hypothetical protein